MERSTKRRKARNVGGWILAIVLGAIYIVSSTGKFGEMGEAMFAEWGYASWFAKLIGGFELLGGLALFIPKATRWAALGLTSIMLGAVYTHLANGEGIAAVLPMVMAGLLMLLYWLRAPVLSRSQDRT